MIRAGEMRHVLRLERRRPNQDNFGQPVDDWELVADSVRAAMRRAPGDEALAADKGQGLVRTEFRIRYMFGVVPQMRLTLIGATEAENAVYDVLGAVDPDGRRSETVITAVELVEAQTTP